MFKKLDGKTVVESSDEVLESDDLNALNQEDFKIQKNILSKKLKNENSDFLECDSGDNLELTDEDTGIQVEMFPNQIAISIAYWDEGEKAKENFKKIFNYLSIIQDESKYSIYDPQEDCEINISEGVEKFLESYGYGVEVLKEIMNQDVNQKKQKGIINSILNMFK